MNYSTIQLAREQLNKFQNDYRELQKKVNLSLFTVSRTNLSAEEKRKVWDGLLEYTKNIVRKVERVLDKLERVRFSSSEIVLHEEKDNLTKNYRALIEKLDEEKKTIERQVEKKIIIAAPLRQKVAKDGYCYFCDISIAESFSYKLRFEEQSVLGIEIAERAAFCSEECLRGYCKEYKNREKFRQEEEKRSKEKIEKDRKMVTEVQEKISQLTERINRLERRERELELSPESDQIEKPENVGFFLRLGRKLGLAKKPHPLSKLERVKKIKGELHVELEKTGEELQKSLIILSLDEQKEKERQKIETKIFLEKERITTQREKEENYD